MRRLPREMCEGLGMPACWTCNRNADRHPEAERISGLHWIKPAARPPQCADYLPIPISARNTTC